MIQESLYSRIMFLLTSFMQIPAHCWSRYRSKGTPRHTHGGILCCILFQLRLAAAHGGDRQLDCSWPLDSCSLLCEVWFHSGKYERGPGEGSWLGQAGTAYSGGFIALSPPGQFSAPSAVEPALPIGFLSLPGLGLVHSSWAQCLGGPATLPPPQSSLTRAKRSTMWALMEAAWMRCLPATDPYSCQTPFFFLQSDTPNS